MTRRGVERQAKTPTLLFPKPIVLFVYIYIYIYIVYRVIHVIPRHYEYTPMDGI